MFKSDVSFKCALVLAHVGADRAGEGGSLTTFHSFVLHQVTLVLITASTSLTAKHFNNTWGTRIV